MYTSVLILKRSLDIMISNNKFIRNIQLKRYYNKTLSPMLSSIRKELFIIKYDELVELYRLIERYNSKDNKKLYIIDDEYDYNTIIVEEKDILKIRIDISFSNHIIKLTVNEYKLDYILEYDFKDKLRYSMYNEYSKDKDQKLITICNTLLVNIYIDLLVNVFFDDEVISIDNSNKINYIEEQYISSLEETVLQKTE